ncbi:MAG: hypothetical protein ACR2QH_10530, partial [Geminicoccaceae bacterium]
MVDRIRPVDVGSVLNTALNFANVRGAQEDRAFNRALQERELQRQSVLQEGLAGALQGTPGALEAVAAADPQAAMSVQNFLSQRSEQEQEDLARTSLATFRELE